MYICIYIILTISSIQFAQGQIKIVTLRTKLGLVNGRGVSVNNDTVYEFRKIPYAKPPIGNLRFSKPQAYGNWSSPLDATEFGPSCMQHLKSTRGLPNLNMSEDCLHLNIYVPRNWSNPFLMPVMVYIHGGGFQQGTGMRFNASLLSLQGQVIVVTLNYRLNVFGFFTTRTPNTTGNYGLWDQRMAIEWVRENINSFGGNPDMITIFGESAGSISVGLHALFPGNKGLFNRAIMQSGPGNSLFSTNNRSADVFTDFSFSVGCTEKPYIVCLRQIDAKSLTQMWYLYKNETATDVLPHFGGLDSPVIDGEFIPSNPVTLIQNTSSPSYAFFRSLDVIAGTTNGEGSLILQKLLPFEKKYSFSIADGISREIFCDYLTPSVAMDYFDKKIAVSNAICKKYSNVSSSDKREQARQAVDMFGDAFFVCPTVQLLNIHSKNNTKKTYQYLFTREFPGRKPPEEWFIGDPHASELMYLFGFKSFLSDKVDVPESEKEFSGKMMQYWINFARSGNPNDGSLPRWPEYNDSQHFVALGDQISSGHNLFQDRVNFWLHDLPKFLL